MYLFQVHQPLNLQYLPVLLPLMVSVMSIPGPQLLDLPKELLGYHADFRMAQVRKHSQTLQMHPGSTC